jgi:hypothetical protein
VKSSKQILPYKFKFPDTRADILKCFDYYSSTNSKAVAFSLSALSRARETSMARLLSLAEEFVKKDPSVYLFNSGSQWFLRKRRSP